MRRLLVLLLLVGWMGMQMASAQAVNGESAPAVEDSAEAEEHVASGDGETREARWMHRENERPGEVYYAVGEKATIYEGPRSSSAFDELDFREPIFVTERFGPWYEVKTKDGVSGFVRSQSVSNVWIHVSKQNRRLSVYKGGELYKRYPADFGYNDFADKERQGSHLLRDHWRTPEGTFYVVRLNEHSQYYRAFVLDYPRPTDADRGLEHRLISQDQHRAIHRAHDNFQMPPMNTNLGGWIEIHGDGTGVATNWTRGCVALTNPQMDELWSLVEVGTPIVIE